MSDIALEIPAFLRELLQKQYGAESERILAGYRAKRPVTLRANTLRTTAEEVEGTLRALGLSYSRVPWYGDAFVLPLAQERELEQTALYARGEIYLQSLSSMLPPLFLSLRRGESVLDMTAAPGGKTTQMAALSGGGALITACERDKVRFDRLKFNLERQGATRVNAMLSDASKLDDFFRFDKILLDAPCSGSGTLEAGAPVRITEKLLAACVKAQEMLLEKGLKLLKKGGVLVYSTCSVLKQENEEILKKVLPRSGARLVPITASFLSELPQLPGAEGTVTVCPSELYEGFFLAMICK